MMLQRHQIRNRRGQRYWTMLNRRSLLVNVWNPRELFAGAEQGLIYDPSDYGTLFQDNLGVTPVTAVGQTVGLILDKSGRGNHATQATEALRPILREDVRGVYLSSEAGTRWMVTGNTDFSGVDVSTAIAGVKKSSDVATAVVFELGPGGGNATFSMFAPRTAATANLAYRSQGTVLADQILTNAAYAAPFNAVLAGTSDISADQVQMYVNNVAPAGPTVTDQGAGNYSNGPIYLMARGGASLQLNGGLYGLIIRGAATDVPTLIKAGRYMGGKMGIPL